MYLLTLTALVILQTALLVQGQTRPVPPDACIDGRYTKAAPSAETGDLGACSSWQRSSCCTAMTAGRITASGARDLYNFTWPTCGAISTECENFLKNEQCFYECEPILDYFQLRDTPAVLYIPVCASYCNAWFDACRNDMTCADNWIDVLNEEAPGNCSAPDAMMCRTFEQVFSDGRGLCNEMWGNTFFYSEDEDNCTVMEFNSSMSNPNFELTFDSGGEMTKTSILIVGLFALLVSIVNKL